MTCSSAHRRVTYPLCEQCRRVPVKSARKRFCSIACSNAAKHIPIAIRFWAKVDRFAGGGCWVWQGATNGVGYGKFAVVGHRRGGKPQLAHRVAYELVVGPIPEGLTLDHLCRNRGCVNPGHLEPVTLAENIRRGFASRRAAA